MIYVRESVLTMLCMKHGGGRDETGRGKVFCIALYFARRRGTACDLVVLILREEERVDINYNIIAKSPKGEVGREKRFLFLSLSIFFFSVVAYAFIRTRKPHQKKKTPQKEKIRK